MKHKLMIGILIGICVIAVGIGLFLFLRPAKRLAIEDMLPSGPFVYVKAKGMAQLIKEIQASDFWQKMQDVNWNRLMLEGGMKPEQVTMLSLFSSQFTRLTSHSLFKKILTGEVAVAVYPAELGMYDMTDITSVLAQVQDLLSHIFIVIHLDPQMKAAEWISGMLRDWGPNVSQRSFEYRGRTVHVVTLEKYGMELGYTVINDYVIFGLKEKAARESLIVLKKDVEALASDPNFQKWKGNFLTGAENYAYINLSMFFPQLMKELMQTLTAKADQAASSEQMAQLERGLKQAEAIQGIGVSFLSGHLSLIKYDFYIDKKKIPSQMQALYSCATHQNATLDFVPRDILGYHWGACNKFDELLRQIKTEIQRAPVTNPQGPSPQEILNQIASSLPVNIEEDLLPHLGDEYGGFLADFDVEGLFPLPKLVFFLEINNPAKTEEVLQKLADNPFFLFQSDTYKGIQIKYISLPLGANLQPAYAYVNNYLLMATSRQLLQTSIEALQDKDKSILGHPLFQNEILALRKKHHGILYLQMDALARKLRALIEWAEKWFSLQENQQSAFAAGSQKRLNEIRQDIEVLEKKIEPFKTQFYELEVELKNLQFQQRKLAEKEESEETLSQIKDIEAKINNAETKRQSWDKEIQATEESLQLAREQETELAPLIKDFDVKRDQAALRQLYFKEFFQPALKALETLDYAGLKVVIQEDLIETTFFLKAQD